MLVVSRTGAWTIASSLALAVFQVGQIIVAARYLSAADFGTLAPVLSVMAIIIGLQEMGLGSYLIHVGELPRRGHSTLFWTNIVFGALTSLLLVGLSGPLSIFFELPDAQLLFVLAGINASALACGSHYQANLIRTFRADRLGQIEVATRAASFLLTLWLLAFQGLGPEAVLIGMIVYSFARAIVLALIADKQVHPSLQFDSNLAKKALRYGADQTASTVLTHARYQLDLLIVTKLFAPSLVGLFFIAKEITTHPVRILGPIISRLTQPEYARAQNDPELLNKVFINSIVRSTVFGGLVYGAVAFFSIWLIEGLYGAKYLGARPYILALAVWGFTRYLSVNIAALAQATGRTSAMLRWVASGSVMSGLVLVGIAVAGSSILEIAVVTSLLQLLVVLSAPLFLAPPLVTACSRSFVLATVGGVLIVILGVGLALIVSLPGINALLALARSLV